MGIKEILLTLATYPEATPEPAIWDAIAIAEALGAKISAVANEMQLHMPGRVHPLADALINIPALARSQIQKSIENADSLLELFKKAAKQSDTLRDAIRGRCVLGDVPHQFAEEARYYDLSIVPISEHPNEIAEAIIFHSGRPTLIVPTLAKAHRSFALNTAVVGWDFSRTAARAVGDALPVLQKMKHVRVVVAHDEKKSTTKASIKKLTRYLEHHKISAVVDELDEASRQTSDVLSAYASRHDADLLIMGAFGHSRLREFILGGVTASMLKQPPLPIFMSH